MALRRSSQALLRSCMRAATAFTPLLYHNIFQVMSCRIGWSGGDAAQRTKVINGMCAMLACPHLFMAATFTGVSSGHTHAASAEAA